MKLWKEKRLVEIADIKGGKRLPTGSSFDNSVTEFPYLRVTDMVNGTIRTNNLVYVSREVQEKIKNYKITKNDIYVTIAGTIGNFGTIPDRLHNSQLTENAAKITNFDNLKFDKKYLVEYLNSDFVQRQIKREIGTGGGVPKLALHRIEKLIIKYPQRAEQTRIAEILSTADEAIEQTEKLIAKYQRIKTGLMQDLLTRGIDERGNIRSKATHKFVVKNGIEVPEEWEVKQIIQTTYLKARIGWQGLKASEFIKDGPYLVTGTDFFDGEIDWDKCYHVSEERFKEAKYIQLSNGDLVITKDGTIGKTAMIKNCPEKAVLNSGVFVIRCNDGSYLNEFMYYILNSKYFFDHLFQTQGGSTINHLYQGEFEKFYFPCPKKYEQEKIVSLLNQINENIKKEMNQLSKLNSIKTGLMQDLLSGRVRVKI